MRLYDLLKELAVESQKPENAYILFSGKANELTLDSDVSFIPEADPENVSLSVHDILAFRSHVRPSRRPQMFNEQMTTRDLEDVLEFIKLDLLYIGDEEYDDCDGEDWDEF